ncbi:MAG: peptidoglycan bridge formation glycyltransferase FemA/FemB family protein [Treponema sp.]|nr:peptidoglycan bridge formation glycyltransferase FemA/FemB family protein [Treponema sp.]
MRTPHLTADSLLLENPILAELNPAEIVFCSGAASFLQSDFWGSFKARFGWKPYPFKAEWETTAGNKECLPLLVLYRRLSFGIGFAYVPWGPELPAGYDTEASQKAAAELAETLRTFIPKNAAFIRFDFPWLINNSNLEDCNNHELHKPSQTGKRSFSRADADVQPPDSVLVDLLPDEKTILGAMKPKWRYNIGLAGKKGVSVRCVAASDIPLESGAGDLASYYSIYKETAERDGISIHGLEYYRILFEEAEKHGVDARLYIASNEGEDIAGIVTLFRGREAVYLYGASSNHKRNLMAPYALQWKAMQDAKASGCCCYDMFGIPPKPPEDDPDHPMAGLYRFKTGFIGDAQDQHAGHQVCNTGECCTACPSKDSSTAAIVSGDQGQGWYAGGKIIHRPGSWDYTCRPLVKTLYSAAEKTRKKIWDIKKRRKRRQ